MKKIAINPFQISAYKNGQIVDAFTDDNKRVRVILKDGLTFIVETLSTLQPYDLIVDYEKPSKNPLRLTEKETQARHNLKEGETLTIYRSSGAQVIDGDTKRVMTREEQKAQGKAREIVIDNKHDTPLRDSNALINLGEQVELLK